MSYNTKIDFSEITGGNILPYVVELDIPNCILDPEAGHNQKFSYTVTGTSSNSGSLYEDLKYIILGIDEKITFGKLKNIAVSINGKDENVRYDHENNNNVSLVNPDEHTGGAGLRFEFELNKKSGVMNISFELSEKYDVGSINVCLCGTDKTAKTGLTIGGPIVSADIIEPKPDDTEQYDNVFDDKYGHKVFNIYVPVSLKPYAKACEPEVRCLGDVCIYPGCKYCDKEYESCDFTMTQKVSVKVPVKYGVITCYEKVCIDEEETVEE